MRGNRLNCFAASRQNLISPPSINPPASNKPPPRAEKLNKPPGGLLEDIREVGIGHDKIHISAYFYYFSVSISVEFQSNFARISPRFRPRAARFSYLVLPYFQKNSPAAGILLHFFRLRRAIIPILLYNTYIMLHISYVYIYKYIYNYKPLDITSICIRVREKTVRVMRENIL